MRTRPRAGWGAASLALLVLLSGCAEGREAQGDTAGGDNADDTARADDTGGGDTSTDSAPPPPRDLDGDGVDDRTDCDDRDPDRTPGAPEAWDGVDNDCDGRVDADGTYSGTLTLDATGVYQGTPHSFRLDCPLTVTRAGRALALEAACTTDPTDENAQRLLGPRLVVSVDEPRVEPTARWSGTYVVRSDSGWDTDGEGSIAFAESLDRVDVVFTVSAPFLGARGAGRAAWAPAAR